MEIEDAEVYQFIFTASNKDSRRDELVVRVVDCTYEGATDKAEFIVGVVKGWESGNYLLRCKEVIHAIAMVE